MIKLAASLAIAAAAVNGSVAIDPRAAPAPAIFTAPAIRLPGFAERLATMPLAAGPAAWRAMPHDAAWRAITASAAATRQAARWAYAGSLIAGDRGPDAIGVLDVMRQDDPDLVLVPAWQRAWGVAQAQAGHLDIAKDALSHPALARDAETCLWRLRVLAQGGAPRSALGQLACAMPALDARAGRARHPFILAATTAGVAAGRYRAALAWLDRLPTDDPAANLLRGKAELALGHARRGRARLERLRRAGTPDQAADAELTLIEAGVTMRTLPVGAALRRLDRLLLGWRGGPIEEAALRLSMRLGDSGGDIARTMTAGAILSRYFDLGAEAGPFVAALQARLAALLAPSSRLPLDQAAGLFWDFRDFAAGGLEGLRLVETLVDRLQAAGLYGRAANLLQYRLGATALDIEKGPLSVRVASLRLLDGDPQTAIRTLRTTDDMPYPPAMAGERRRVEAAALSLLGKNEEALAVLEDVPDAAAIRAEIYWRERDWAQLERAGIVALPPSGRLNEVGQAIVLRHAIALAMLGHEDALARLRARYAAGFAGAPTAAAFALLTGPPGTVDPAAIAKAMGALPGASPAGAFGELIDASRAAMAGKPAA